MATTKREKLFTEFPPVSTEQWEEVIKADLKGADYERKLVWKTPEGFNVRPYYRAENLAGLKFLGSEAGVFPYVRGTRAHNRWKIHQTVIVNCPKEANAVALKILNAGVDSIEFQIVPETFSAEDLNTLLKDIHIPAVEITFSGSKTAHVAELVIAKIEKEQLPAEEVHINFCIDPLVKKLTSKGSFCSENGAKCFEKIADLVRKTKTYKGIRVITVSGEIFSNAGSTIVEALAFSLAAGHDYLVRLMDMGFTIEEAAKKIRFSQAITSNYFMEIAKLRAGRMLWANIVKAYNPAKNCPCKMFTHAVTSTWNQTAYDPYVNMLRGTTEAMSASIAGVHSLEVTPFNKAYEDPNEFSMRIARNVELLLKHESHFDQVVDPAGGSYYIENLTDSIANEAWKLFREIEELLELLVCLAREACHERRARRDARYHIPHVLEHLEVFRRRALSVHGLEDVGVGMLQGHVEVLADVVMGVHDRQQLVVDAGGLQVQQPEPNIGKRGCRRVEQLCSRLGGRKVTSPDPGVLADEHDLADAALHELGDLVEDLLLREAVIAAANIGNHAVRAEAVAAVGDLHVRAGPLVAADARAVGRKSGGKARRVDTQQLLRLLDDVFLVCSAQETRDLGQLGLEVVAIPGGHAACDENLGLDRALCLLVDQVEYDFEALVDCAHQKRAGVDHDEGGIRGIAHHRKARSGEPRLHLVGIDFVLCASERDECDVHVLRHVRSYL